MRNASKTSPTVTKITRATFEVPTDLYLEFKEICTARDLTFSQAMRKAMREMIEQREAA